METYKSLTKKSDALTKEGKPHVLFVYVGGHGATDNEHQVFFLNSEDGTKASFPVEFRLRSLINRLSMIRIFAVYDCSRVPLRNFIGISSDMKGGLG